MNEKYDYGWMLVNPNGFKPCFCCYMKRTKQQVIAAWCDTFNNKPWSYWYRKGWRVEKITVTYTKGWSPPAT